MTLLGLFFFIPLPANLGAEVSGKRFAEPRVRPDPQAELATAEAD
jgi:hypothetical protein